jgi:hypothetical protein
METSKIPSGKGIFRRSLILKITIHYRYMKFTEKKYWVEKNIPSFVGGVVE